MSKTIEVRIQKGGKVIIKPTGYSGPACENATRNIVAALGQKVTDERTADYYGAAKHQTTINN